MIALFLFLLYNVRLSSFLGREVGNVPNKREANPVELATFGNEHKYCLNSCEFLILTTNPILYFIDFF